MVFDSKIHSIFHNCCHMYCVYIHRRVSENKIKVWLKRKKQLSHGINTTSVWITHICVGSRRTHRCMSITNTLTANRDIFDGVKVLKREIITFHFLSWTLITCTSGFLILKYTYMYGEKINTVSKKKMTLTINNTAQ